MSFDSLSVTSETIVNTSFACWTFDFRVARDKARMVADWLKAMQSATSAMGPELRAAAALSRRRPARGVKE
jgi:hypothetical protein